jgi:hypothetical protein
VFLKKTAKGVISFITFSYLKLLLTDDVENCWMKEAMEDSMRILREARKRKRRQMRNLSKHDS